MLNLLEMLELDGAIELTCTLDESKPADKAKLKKAKNILILNIESSLYSHIEDANTATEIWEKLHGLYENSGWSRRVSLLRQLMSTRLETS